MPMLLLLPPLPFALVESTPMALPLCLLAFLPAPRFLRLLEAPPPLVPPPLPPLLRLFPPLFPSPSCCSTASSPPTFTVRLNARHCARSLRNILNMAASSGREEGGGGEGNITLSCSAVKRCLFLLARNSFFRLAALAAASGLLALYVRCWFKAIAQCAPSAGPESSDIYQRN